MTCKGLEKLGTIKHLVDRVAFICFYFVLKDLQRLWKQSSDELLKSKKKESSEKRGKTFTIYYFKLEVPKGQLNSELIYEVIVSPKMQT